MTNPSPNSNNKSLDRVPTQSQPDFRSDVDKKYTPLSTHNELSPDISFAQNQANEMIQISGAELFVFIRTNNTHNKVIKEDANPTYYSGVQIKGFFAPKTIEMKQTMFGPDASNQVKIVFSREHIFKLFGDRMLRSGDIIELPFGGSSVNPKRYKVLNGYDFGNFKYHWLYFACDCENIMNDTNLDITHR